MRNVKLTACNIVGCVILLGAGPVHGQDWPQWRGPNRDGKATGFKAPKTWPKELTQKWKVTVGEGVATPALVGDKLFVFSRQGDNEVLRCLDAADHKEVWQQKYSSAGFRGADSGFQGPRCSPAVADGKVVVLGANGILSCYDAGTGKPVWTKDQFKGSVPRFHTSSSPIVVDGLCIAQLGAGGSGGIMAYNLADGAEKWKWTGDGPAYASPVLLIVDGTKVIVASTAAKVVAISAADGKELWKTSFPAGQMQYNASTPVVDGAMVIYGGVGRGTTAVKLEKKGDAITAKEVWKNSADTVQYNSPVLKDGHIFGVSGADKLFCVNAETGKTAWTTSIPSAGGRQRGYASIVDAGPVLFELNLTGQLIVFEPSAKEFKEIAKYKVAAGDTYAYPIIAGNRVFVKDKDAVTLWTIE